VKLFVCVKLILLGHVSESRNIVEHFAHLDWLEQKLMENLLVVITHLFNRRMLCLPK